MLSKPLESFLALMFRGTPVRLQEIPSKHVEPTITSLSAHDALKTVKFSRPDN